MGDRSLTERVAVDLVMKHMEEMMKLFEFQVAHEAFPDKRNLSSRNVYLAMRRLILKRLRLLRAETLGVIVFYADDLHETYSSTYLNGLKNGREILREAACLAMASEMASVFNSRIRN